MPPKRAPSLIRALEETRPGVEAGLRETEDDLDALREEQRELESQIARARAMLAEDTTPETSLRRLTLPAAMGVALDERGNRWMTVNELADEINLRRLYEKRDRSSVEPGQIHARANKYPNMFEKDGPRVRRAGVVEHRSAAHPVA